MTSNQIFIIMDDDILLVFALCMGILFALLAYNKKGTLASPIAGALACMVFWAFFNAYSLNYTDWIVPAWDNHVLWSEALATSLIAVIVGESNTYEKQSKRIPKRMIVPAILLVITIIL